MGLMPQETCHRCGRQYSGLHQRCPYCGTPKVRQSSRVPGTTPDAVKNSPSNQRLAQDRRWQIIVGAILIVAVLAAFIALITTDVMQDPNAGDPNNPPVPEMTPVPTPPPSAAPQPTATPEITQLQIFYFSDNKTGGGFTATVGSKTPLTPMWFPQSVLSPEYSWSSSDESVATIGEDGVVVAVGAGSATITLTCYGQTATTQVVVK